MYITSFGKVIFVSIVIVLFCQAHPQGSSSLACLGPESNFIVRRLYYIQYSIYLRTRTHRQNAPVELLSHPLK